MIAPAAVHRAGPALGRAMRSTAIDREAAQLMGVDINTTIALTFFIGSALAGAAGVVQGLTSAVPSSTSASRPASRPSPRPSSAASATPPARPLGGFVIGFLEVISAVYGYGRWSEAVVFSVLVIVLVFRPTGILGQQLAERA